MNGSHLYLVIEHYPAHDVKAWSLGLNIYQVRRVVLEKGPSASDPTGTLRITGSRHVMGSDGTIREEPFAAGVVFTASPDSLGDTVTVTDM